MECCQPRNEMAVVFCFFAQLIILHPWNSWIIWKLYTLRCCRNRFLYPVVDCFIYTYVTGPRVCCSSYWCDSSMDYLFALSTEPCLRPALGTPDRDKSKNHCSSLLNTERWFHLGSRNSGPRSLWLIRLMNMIAKPTSNGPRKKKKQKS